MKGGRLELWDEHMVIDLEPVEKLRRRMRQRPQNVIDVCSGMSGVRAVMEDLGYNIGEWLAVENNSRATAAVPCGDVGHSRQEGMVEHAAAPLVAGLGGAPHWFLGGPNCQEFSAANPDAQGMESTGGDLSTHVCRLAAGLMVEHPELKG